MGDNLGGVADRATESGSAGHGWTTFTATSRGLGQYWQGVGGNANMVRLDVFLALLSGISNGLFTAPMKVIPRWKWRRLPERPAPLAPYSKP